ncbi:flavoprotein [Tessaracoccus sp. OH4464_COT-324]|uniref:flavoprotein n=1 Tax=Tessaracoccus sp. OH4464_COT-324 TaxID=2491059 RepID=UPI000F640870|nr:flavoprotein [Tessaracoccus sp. OH4464_COT-324]RRD47796.1 flavoprotein domain protein [Tessaracoccus sp. OH4464_COT-324]
MTEQEIERIIRRVLAEFGLPARRPRALVLFTGALLGFDDSLAALRRLTDAVQLDWTRTPSAERILDEQRIADVGMTPAADSLTTAHDLLIVPTATVNLFAKVAHGIGDCLASNLMAEFIMSNRPVIAVVDGACPDSEAKRGWFPNMPAAYQAMLHRNLEMIRSFGVTLTPATLLDEAVLGHISPGRSPASEKPAKEELRLVTQATVALAPEGSTLGIAPRAIVTDLARDLAHKRNITFQQRS